MPLRPCRLAPAGGSLKGISGFVSLHRCSDALYTISHRRVKTCFAGIGKAAALFRPPSRRPSPGGRRRRKPGAGWGLPQWRRIDPGRAMLYTSNMIHRRFRQKPYRRPSLDATGAGPWLRLAALVAVLVAVVLFLALVAAPYLSRWIKSGLPYPWSSPTPAPSTTPAADAAPLPATDNPVLAFSPGAEAGFRRLTDASVFDGALLFAAGDDASTFDRLFRLDLSTGALTAIDAVPENDTFRYPVESDRFLAVFDARSDGGGDIRVLDRAGGDWFTIRTVESGLPCLRLDGAHLAWSEPADGRGGVLYVCDLSAAEPACLPLVTLATAAYADCAPCLTDGRLVYADGTADSGEIHSIFLAGGEPSSFSTGGPAFNPCAIGTSWAWLTAEEGGELYLSVDSGVPQRIAYGVSGYGLTEEAAVYGAGEMVFCCLFADGRTYLLSETGTRAEFLCAGDGYAVWRVLGDLSRDAIRYMRLG